MLEKVTPQRRERGLHQRKSSGQPPPGLTAVHPPLLQATPKPTNGTSSAPVTVREDTPWSSTGKMLGNLFEERNWVLPKDSLATEDKKEDATITKPPLKEESKMGEQTSSQKEEKCGWGPNCPFCKAQKKDGEDQQQKPLTKPQAKRPKTLSMTKMRQQWEEEMERLNTKYNLDSFSDSECYVRQCSLVLKIVLDFFICLGFCMQCISLYDALSLHNCLSSGSLVFTHLGSIY